MAAWEMQVDSSLAFCQSRWPFVRDFGELRFMMDMFFPGWGDEDPEGGFRCLVLRIVIKRGSE